MKVKAQEDYEITYSADHWELFRAIRQRAMRITGLFAEEGFATYTFGSVARGDIKATSDVDIILQQRIPTFRVEIILDQAEIPVLEKKIVQATPNDVIKANYQLEDDVCLTVLLTDFTRLPFEFYKFGGAVTHEQMLQEVRVPGVDKQLLLIQPTPTGHHASSIIQQPQVAAQIIGVSTQIVEERVRVLERRDKVGRTGVYLNVPVAQDESCENVLNNLAKTNPMIRRRMSL
jgi:predicted nucleotidyltransferase